MSRGVDMISPWRPGTGLVLFSAIVGLCVFAGVLLYGPEAPRPELTPLTGPDARPNVRNNVFNSISAGRDRHAIDELSNHLKTDPGFGWGWRIMLQLASRDAAFNSERDLAKDRLSEFSATELGDEFWAWDRRTEGVALMAAGRTDEARAVFADSIERVKSTNFGNNFGIEFFLEGALLAMGGQHDAALSVLEQAVEDERYLGSEWFRHTPDLDSLRSDPEFAARFEALIVRTDEILAARQARLNEPDPPDTTEPQIDSGTDDP